MKEFQAKYNIQVKKIQCDNAGENHALKALCKKDGNSDTFEYKMVMLNKSLKRCLAE